MLKRAQSMFVAAALVIGPACSGESSGVGDSVAAHQSGAGGGAAGGDGGGAAAAGTGGGEATSINGDVARSRKGGKGGKDGGVATGGTGGGAATGGSGGGVATGGSGGPADPAWVWAITIDDPWSNRPAIVDSLASLKQSMTARIVFDEGMKAADYDAPVRDIASVAAVQGELLDSLYVPQYSVSQYVARANEYLNQLGDVVSIWEVGNEVNGEWVGKAADVSAKILGAYHAVKAHGGRTALTLYYNGLYDGGMPTANNCWDVAGNQMQVWATANVPAEMKAGLDYVWVSYYEDDCNGIQPKWPAVFADLATMFPNSKIGMGECGTAKAASKVTYINRYYRDMVIPDPRFVGGFFWWWGKQDFVPKSDPLWPSLQDAMNAREASWP